jgi:hypothetical protein
LIATNDDLRDPDVSSDVLAAKLVSCVEQACLLLTLQLTNCISTDGQ